MGDSSESHESVAVAAQSTTCIEVNTEQNNENNSGSDNHFESDDVEQVASENQKQAGRLVSDEPKDELDCKKSTSAEQANKVTPINGKPREIIQIRLLVRRREAGALIGKKGSNIKRLRETFSKSNFSIPDTGNGPERVVCISSDSKTMTLILNDVTKLLLEKSSQRDDQIELKLLIHSWFAGLLIGMGGQSIKKLRNVRVLSN